MTNTSAPQPTRIERTYGRSVSELWSLWTTQAGFESWWGPDGFRGEVHELVAAPQGTLHYTMRAASAEMLAAMEAMGAPTAHEVRAHFSAFDPERSLTISSLIDFLPGVAPYESLIEVALTPLATGTQMVMILHPMHDAATSAMQVEGFTSQLGKLDERFR